MIEKKTLKELIKLMVENDLTELDLQDPQGERVTIKRGLSGPVLHAAPGAVPPAAAASPGAAGVPGAAPGLAGGADEGLVAIKSPMVGTFYAAPSPDAKPFVAVGDKVSAETVVCIIEAMKVFNEIHADVSGTVAKVLVSNGQVVEFGQPLFMVKAN